MQWDNAKLQPVIITYNRSQYLRQTLRAFVDAGLADMQLHILDNASTDDTASVVREMQSVWPSLVYHRNAYNIGGNGNILRAVEITSSDYCWVLGDDDKWAFDALDELRREIKLGRADIIRLGWLVPAANKSALADVADIAMREPSFFVSLSLLSNAILRRSLVIDSLPKAYMNTGDAFPHLVPILCALNARESLSVYSLGHEMVRYVPNPDPGYYTGDLEWHSSWFRTSRFVADPRLRRKFIRDCLAFLRTGSFSRIRQFVLLLKIALKFKALGVDQRPYLFSMAAYGVGRQGSMLLILFLYQITPKFLLRRLIAKKIAAIGLYQDGSGRL